MKRSFFVLLVIGFTSFSLVAGEHQSSAGPHKRPVAKAKSVPGVRIDCDGKFGTFKITLSLITDKRGLVAVSVEPIKVENGDIASIYFSKNDGAFKSFIPQVVLQKEFPVGNAIDAKDLITYDQIDIFPWRPELTIPQEADNKVTCEIPKKAKKLAKKAIEQSKRQKRASKQKKVKKVLKYTRFYCDTKFDPWGSRYGKYDVYLVAANEAQDLFELIIVPVKAPGGKAMITVAGKDLVYKVLHSEATLKKNKEFSAGFLSLKELKKMEHLIITSPQKNIPFLEGTVTEGNRCTIPMF